MEQKRVAPYAEAFRQQMVELVAAGRRPMDLARGAHVLQAAQSARANASRMALSTQERDEIGRAHV